MNKVSARLRRSWAFYFFMVFLFLAATEAWLRVNKDAVSSLREGALLKVQLFLSRSETTLLFLGTSRAQDGIDPTLLVGEMAKANPAWKDARFYNGAAAGGSLGRLEYSVDRVLEKPGLRYLGLEVSPIQLSDNEYWLSNLQPQKKSENGEERLQQWLADHVFLVRYRQTFRLESLLKLPLLIFPDSSDGSKWFGQAGGFGNKSMPDVKNGNGRFERLVDSSVAGRGEVELLPEAEKAISVYERIAKKVREKGVSLFLFVPPAMGEECTERHVQTYLAMARATGAPLLQYSCKDQPVKLFADYNHLTPEGKVAWSRQLALDLPQLLKEAEGARALQ